MHSILIVSIAFPPKRDPEGLQVAKYLKYLLRDHQGKFTFNAITSASALYMPVDNLLNSYRQGLQQIISLPLLENKYLNYLLNKYLPCLIARPDTRFSFHLWAPLIPLLLHQPPDLIYSRAFPLSSAVMGCKLKHIYKVPWVMHLSDPWADSPAINYQGKVMKNQQHWEQQCFAAADVISVTTRRTQIFYQNKYPQFSQRIQVFPNSYDPEDCAASPLKETLDKYGRLEEENSKLRIVYTGGLTRTLPPTAFLAALQLLDPSLLPHVEVIFAGQVERAMKAALNRANLSCLTYQGEVSFQQSLLLQRTADLLLYIDRPVKEVSKRIILGSKLLDYMTTGLPILGLAEAGSEVEEFLLRRGDAVFPHQATTQIAEFLSQKIRSFLTDGRSQLIKKPLLPEYSAANNAARLSQLFTTLLTH